MRIEDLTSLNEQIAAMAQAGLPLDRGLSALARDMSRGKLRRTTERLARDLHAGKTLPEALSARKDELPAYYSALAMAGIRTGRLAEVLATITAYGKSVANTRQTINDAMFYPMLVLFFAFGILVGSLVFVVPEFESFFHQLSLQVNLRIPTLTQYLFYSANHILHFLYGSLACVATMIALLYGGKLIGGRMSEFSDHLLYSVPILGTLYRSARLEAFTELLALLTKYETPLPEAFRTAGLASADSLTRSRALLTAEQLEQGTPLAAALTGRALIPGWVAWMAGEGERVGELSEAFKQISRIYHRQVEVRAAALRSIFPPIIVMLTAGFITLLFISAVVMPIASSLDGLSR